MKLRYGLNPQQTPAWAEPVTADRWPFELLNGAPSYINVLDALNGWQLVREADHALGRAAAASFKHVSPAGAAVEGPVSAELAATFGVDGEVTSAVTAAYLRARDADPKSSYGDFVAVSRTVDVELADAMSGLVCDGIIAPGYEPAALERLARKKKGAFPVLRADPDVALPATEEREVCGVRLGQQRDPIALDRSVLGDEAGAGLEPSVADDLVLGLIVLRYTQSNSTCYVRDGVTVGIGAGQQSRVDCTRLAGQKTDLWWLRRHPAVRALEFVPSTKRQDRINWQLRFIEGDLTPDESARMAEVLVSPSAPLDDATRAAWSGELTGVSFASDGALPFRDNVDHAQRHGVVAIAEPGGSIRSDEVAQAAAEHGIALVRTGVRLFHH